MISKEELEILLRETFEEYQSATEVVKKLRALEGTLRKAKKTQSKTSALLEKLMAQCERLYPGLAKRLKKELHNKNGGGLKFHWKGTVATGSAFDYSFSKHPCGASAPLFSLVLKFLVLIYGLVRVPTFTMPDLESCPHR